MKRSRVGATIHWGRLVLVAVVGTFVIAAGIGQIVDHKYGQGAVLLIAAVIAVAPTIATQWYVAHHPPGPERPWRDPPPGR